MRDLKPGDRVKITGPWVKYPGGAYNGGLEYIGKIAVVEECSEKVPGWTVRLRIGSGQAELFLWWCRENLRAMPRSK